MSCSRYMYSGCYGADEERVDTGAGDHTISLVPAHFSSFYNNYIHGPLYSQLSRKGVVPRNEVRENVVIHLPIQC